MPQETTPTTDQRPVLIWYMRGPPESPLVGKKKNQSINKYIQKTGATRTRNWVSVVIVGGGAARWRGPLPGRNLCRPVDSRRTSAYRWWSGCKRSCTRCSSRWAGRLRGAPGWIGRCKRSCPNLIIIFGHTPPHPGRERQQWNELSVMKREDGDVPVT